MATLVGLTTGMHEKNCAMAKTNVYHLLYKAIMVWDEDTEAAVTAIRLADREAQRLQQDIYIAEDLSIHEKKPKGIRILETVRYLGEDTEQGDR